MDILDLLQSGPKTTKELVDTLTGQREMTEKTFHKRVKELVEEGKLLKLPIPSPEGGWSSLYALPAHEKRAIAMSGYIPTKGNDAYVGAKLAAALARLRGKLLRNPAPDEALMEAGENPEDRPARDLLYRVGASNGWRPPTEEEVKRAQEELTWTLKLAARLKQGATEESLAQVATAEEIRGAKEYLERFPDAVV